MSLNEMFDTSLSFMVAGIVMVFFGLNIIGSFISSVPNVFFLPTIAQGILLGAGFYILVLLFNALQIAHRIKGLVKR